MILLVNDSKDDTGLLLAFRQVGVPYPMRRLSTIGKLIAYLSGDGAYADRKKHPLPAAIVFDVDVPFEEAFVMLT